MPGTRPNSESISKVLLIEDCKLDAECMLSALRDSTSTLECSVIKTREDLEKSLENRSPDVIISDHDLITWTAMDVLDVIHRSGRDIPIIIVSGVLGDERAAEYIKHGAYDYVLKDKLLRLPIAVDAAIREKRQRREHSQVLESRNIISSELQKAESLLINVMHAVPDPIWLKDSDGVLLACNTSFEKMIGMSRSEAIGKNTYDLMPHEIAEQVRERDRLAISSELPSYGEEWITSRGTTHRALYETIKLPVKDKSGKLLGLVGIARDITERFQAEQELRIAACAFEAQEGILITDANHIALRANRALLNMTGFAAEELIGKHVSSFASNRQDGPATYQKIAEQLAREDIWQGEVWNRRKNGEVYPGWLTVSAVRNKEGVVTNHVGMLLDISAQKRAASEIERLAYHDALTGLANRRLMIDRLQHALATIRHFGSTAAFYLIDLDNFKFLNDTLGHESGDLFLVEVGKRLSHCIRDGDSIARFGSDEFTVLAENLASNRTQAAIDAKETGEKILRGIEEPYEIDGTRCCCSASIGMTLLCDPSVSADEILKQADIAMFEAKRAGRAAIRPFDPEMQVVFSERTALEHALRSALENHEFALFVQPQVDINLRIIGVEALLRWNSLTLGPVEPNKFIPMAEETDLILPMGDWVLETACKQLAAWKNSPLYSDLILSVNVSAKQFREELFVSKVEDLLRTTSAPPDHLMMELTESTMVTDFAEAAAKMRSLRNTGPGFAIDDFGTGFSSLAYLASFPLAQLKIDRTFVQQLGQASGSTVIIRTILDLGKSLGLRTIAEGVETEMQYQILRDLGCSMFQGYYFGRPTPIVEFEAEAMKTWDGRFLMAKQFLPPS